MTNYPRDEFDKVPETSSRQGVHRTRTEQTGHGLAPVLIAGAVALIIGLLAFFVLPHADGAGKAGATNAPSLAAAGSPTNSAAPSAPASSQASASPATAAASPTAETTPAAPAVDKATNVVVLNASGVAGLGARVGGQVQSGGWPVGLVANWQGQAQPSSVIFYNGQSQLGNAQALGSLLNITRLVDTAELRQPLTVVIGPGFK